jgi:hypothetical protein
MHDSNVYRPPQTDLTASSKDDLHLASISGLLAPHVRVVLLAGFFSLFLIWFAYDGWLNQDPGMVQHRLFNQVMTVVSAAIILPLLYLARRVQASVRDRKSSRSALLILSPDGCDIRVATAPWLWALVFSGLNLIPHKRPGLGVLLFVGSQLTLGLVGVGLAICVRGILERQYDSMRWTQL